MRGNSQRWRDRIRDRLERVVGDGPHGRGGHPFAEAGAPPPLRELLESLPGVESGRISEGAWQLQWSAPEGAAEAGRLLSGRIEAMTRRSAKSALHADFHPLGPAAPEDLLFFDLETLGLGNAGVFLIGCMRLREGRLEVQQLLAQDYSEEGAILEAFAGGLRPGAVLVSFNGKSYDLPLLCGRAGVWRVELPADRLRGHVDVLYECRRKWSGALPDCRLTTLERALCGRRRDGDVPGAEIPRIYHRFVESGDGRLIEPVLRHNVLDLVTLAEVLLECLS